MNKTRHDLPQSTRTKVADLLNAHLAIAIDLGLQAKQAHWNVKGPQFMQLHELFDKLRGAVDEAVDALAERAVMLGGQAEGTVAAVAERSNLKAYPIKLTDGREHLKALADNMAIYGKGLRKAIDQAAAMGDADTADLFTGLSRDADKYLWFVEAHLS